MGRDEEIDKELRFHIDARIDDLVASGMAPEEARRRTRLEFGGVMQTKEAVRDQSRWSIVNGLTQDCRLAFRALRAAPIVSFVALLSLTLGIGANTAIFSIVNSLVLRPLPVAEPQQLANLSGGLGPTSTWTYPIWSEIRRRADAFDGALAWSSLRFNLAQGGEMQPVNGMYVSGGFFTTLAVPAVIGRTFTDADDVRGGGAEGAVAVISHGFWQRHFGAAASAVGATLVIERVPYTVVGVTPAAFYGPEVGRAFDVAVPIGTDPLIRGKDSTLDNRTNYWLNVMIRLKRDQSLEAATAALRGMQPQIQAATMPQDMLPRFQAEFLSHAFSMQPAAGGLSGLRQRYERPLVTLLVVVGLVLLIACANIANLQLARTAARRHELSVRVALGASRWRLARQFLVESVLLASVGALAGMAVASWASRLLVGLLSSTVNTVFLDLSLDWRVLAFTMLVTAATTVLFGALPAFRASAAAPIDALKEQGRGTAGGARQATAGGLVVAQVALSLVLLVGAGLFIRTFVGLATLPLGFDIDRVVVVNVNASRAHIDPANRIPFYYQLVDAVAAVPGVAYAGGSVISPVSGGGLNNFVDVAGAPEMSEKDRTSLVNFVTPGWFAAYGTPIHVGRDFSNRDAKTALPVTLVNEAFARKFFPGRNPLGGTVKFLTGRPGDVQMPKTVVGVVADAVYRSLRDPATPTMYVPLSQWTFPFPMTGISIGVRATSGSPMVLARSVASALSAVDPDLAFNFRLLAEQVNATLAQERIVALLSGFFGGLALLLAALGLYGLTSYAVAQRRSEIGIRMALGAAPSGVIRLLLTRVACLIGAGVIVGTGISLWASTFVGALLYGLEPRDPATLAGAAITLASVGVVAGWPPAYRASRIDPAAVLRDS
jgi:putative ABC transport system permease protein